MGNKLKKCVVTRFSISRKIYRLANTLAAYTILVNCKMLGIMWTTHFFLFAPGISQASKCVTSTSEHQYYIIQC